MWKLIPPHSCFTLERKHLATFCKLKKPLWALYFFFNIRPLLHVEDLCIKTLKLVLPSRNIGLKMLICMVLIYRKMLLLMKMTYFESIYFHCQIGFSFCFFFFKVHKVKQKYCDYITKVTSLILKLFFPKLLVVIKFNLRENKQIYLSKKCF